MTPVAIGFIFARGGSKSIPRKNIRPLAGKPLLAWAIETARATPSIQRVIVSTDDPEIAAVARTHGAEVPFLRPAALARDDTPEWLAWQHAIRTVTEQGLVPRMDAFVSIPTTSPLRASADVEACIQRLWTTDADCVITVQEANRNPYFNMVTIDPDGNARLVCPPEEALYGRQAAPVVYDMTTVAYAARPDYILQARSLFDGRVKTVAVDSERAIDIDTACDFRVAEALLAPVRLSTPAPVFWFTGLSGSGKSTLAQHLSQTLTQRGCAVEYLDGDTIRDLFPTTGFSRSERDAHVRRVGHLASRLAHHGICVVASLISPYEDSRQFVRALCPRFVEIYVATPFAECERRDAKGLYRRARNGDLPNFTGLDDPYEPPRAPEVTVDTAGQSVAASMAAVLSHLDRHFPGAGQAANGEGL